MIAPGQAANVDNFEVSFSIFLKQLCLEYTHNHLNEAILASAYNIHFLW